MNECMSAASASRVMMWAHEFIPKRWREARQLPEPARHHHDISSVRHDPEKGIGHVQRAEEVDLQRPSGDLGVEVVRVDARIVDQSIKPRAFASELIGESGDARRIDDVELAVLHGKPLFGEASRGGVAVLGPAREQHVETTSGKLPARLQTETQVRAGYEGSSSRYRIAHPSSIEATKTGRQSALRSAGGLFEHPSQKPLAIGPRPVTRIGVDVSRGAKIDEARAPRLSKGLRLRELAVWIIGR
jgi:hypothetical protein